MIFSSDESHCKEKSTHYRFSVFITLAFSKLLHLPGLITPSLFKSLCFTFLSLAKVKLGLRLINSSTPWFSLHILHLYETSIRGKPFSLTGPVYPPFTAICLSIFISWQNSLQLSPAVGVYKTNSVLVLMRIFVTYGI